MWTNKHWRGLWAGLIVVALAGAAWAKDKDKDHEHAGDKDWTELGEVEVSNQDRDNRVQIKADDTAVTHIRLRVGQQPVRINSIVVGFDGGDTQTISVNQTIQPGETTKVYNLEGKKRRIERIVINGSTTGKEDRSAKLILYGQSD